MRAQTNTYIVLRIGNSEEVNQFRIEVTKGSNTFYYNGAAFKRIHKSETSHKYYAHPNSNLQSGDELQVQKGTVTGEVTEYRGPRRRRILHRAGRQRQPRRYRGHD